jgi:hypothetical protein
MDLHTSLLDDPFSNLPFTAGVAPGDSPVESTAGEEEPASGRRADGANASRRNSTKSGMTATEVFPEPLQILIDQLLAELTDHYRPRPGIETRTVRELSINWAKLEYAHELRKLDVARVKTRAALCWDSDQRAIAERRARKLTTTPEKVVPALERTKQGVLLLLESWTALQDALLTNGALDEAQHRLVFDLLGIALELRNGSRRVPAAHDGPALAALVTAQMDRLRSLLDASLNQLDEEHRKLALAGMPYAGDAETQNLKRYETTARNKRDKAREEFRRARAEWEQAEQERRRREREAFEQTLIPPRTDVDAFRQAVAAVAAASSPPPGASPTVTKPFVVPAADRTPDGPNPAADLLDIARRRIQRKPFVQPARKSADRQAGARKGRRRGR